MRNLRNTRFDRWNAPAQFSGRPLTATTWDLANDSVLCAFGPTENDPLIELVRVNIGSDTSEHSIITSWDAPCPNPELACDEILSLHYFGDSLTACLVLAGGDIVVVREEPRAGEDRIEIVGSVDAGITAARWSPDEELLAITTRADTVVFMSRSFEGVTDVTMTPEDLKASNHVSVGWGKKETQFQGRGAKALKDPTMPEKIDEGVLSSNDDHRVSISWRGDGAYLAVSTIEGGARRILRVYSREGVLDSVSEPVDGLESALSWRPAGNLISGVQRFKDRVDVVFFERNGLRHGQFSLRLTSEQLQSPDQNIKLIWNSDSTVLAVIMADCIQLWTMGNYHWYLKHEVAIGGLQPVCPVVWHSEKPLRFTIGASDGFTLIEYIFTTARGPISPPEDYGPIAVIDGKIIKVTPFRAANIPPPMALHEVEVQSNALDVAFNADTSLVASLHSQGISLFEWKAATVPSVSPNLTGRVTFAQIDRQQSVYQQICFGRTNELLVLKRCDSESNSVVDRYGFDDVTGRIELISSETEGVSYTLLSSFQGDTAYPFVQSRSGDLHSLTTADRSTWHCSFPHYLPWVDVLLGIKAIAFGMSENGHLYANSRLLLKNCTSFLVTPAHLILTTTTHLLKFVHITNVDDLEVPPDDPEKDERCRSIERGARLVTAMPTSLSLVLQMPRGNLETIFPRAMVLAGIRKLIDEKNYKKAFTHCRTQRVDMNLLYDHAPAQFLANVPLFIDQVKKITYLDLFLSSLREEDVTQSMYKETRAMSTQENGIPEVNGINGVSHPEPSSGKTSKVNKVCDAFLEIMKARTSTNLQNIITANVCKSPPALDDGLLVVAQLMTEDSQMADKAVEHICFLADVNKLYDNALGLYNLDLALLVAQQSQKDPREYLPFMQNLQEIPELRRRFSIDDHLGRHNKALEHLHSLDAFLEVQTYTQKHALYQQALSLYRYNPSQHSTLTNLYAQYLESKSSFKEAALAYESLNNYEKATSCYLSSGPSSWRESLYCALSQTPPISGPALTDLATTLYDALIESKDYFAAATIQLDYLSSIPNACRAFCKGYFFADALHLIAMKRTTELLEQVIDPCLGDALASSTELLSDCKAQLLAQIPRILELREKALLDPLAFYEGERGGGADGDLPDDVSVAASSRLSTNRSLFTRYTGKGGSVGTAGTGVSRATSKNRRREERKRARGKKGSVYEEEYLVNSVRRLIERVESVRGEVGRLVEGLVRRGMWERARAVEVALAEVIEMCRGCVPEVFGTGESVKVEGEVGADGEVYRAVGGDAVLQESLEAAGKKKEPPLIAAFQKLALLGT
ncbi:elongator complex protein-like protein 1 [Mollisia scopiformis]|uniref:Elongator complex protein 1 n=1 Tax=Mollisia scopiformis TaxID=149040 RepID=A0A194WVM2_MOLSC|nr:elongator complex protein-like protein 1 [Mollisia scopiformis]KUJ12018.1 elongator complex protein-like protein 1 [Mollisia scopiformis]